LDDLFLWCFGFSEPRAIAIDRFSVLFAGLPAPLRGKDFLQRGQDLVHRFRGQRSQTLHQPLAIDGSQLLQDNEP